MTKYKFKEFKRIRGEKYIKLKDGHIYISPAVIRSWGDPKEIKIKYDKAAGAILLDPLWAIRRERRSVKTLVEQTAIGEDPGYAGRKILDGKRQHGNIYTKRREISGQIRSAFCSNKKKGRRIVEWAVSILKAQIKKTEYGRDNYSMSRIGYKMMNNEVELLEDAVEILEKEYKRRVKEMFENAWTKKVEKQAAKIKKLEAEVKELRTRFIPKIRSINGVINKPRKRG